MNDTLNDDALIGVPEVAKRLGIAQNTLRDLARRGEVPHVRVGRAIKFSRPHLEQWIAGGGNGGVPLPDRVDAVAPLKKPTLRYELRALGLPPALITALSAEAGPRRPFGQGLPYATVEDLRKMPYREIRTLPGVGRTRLAQLLAALGRHDEIPDD